MRISYNRTLLWTGPINEVLVWTFHLDEINTEAVSTLLSPDERDRAARFRFDLHRGRYIAGRAGMRIVLGGLLNVPPESLVFVYGEHGKPALQSGELHFNLSNSDHRAVLGVTRAAPIGIDVERINPERGRPEIAERFFAPEEIAELTALKGDAYTYAFFQLWARKEAVLKAMGTGISGGLSSFAVPHGPLPQAVHIPSQNCWVGNLSRAFPYLEGERFSSAVALLAHEPLIRPVCDTVFRIPVRRTLK